MRLSITKKLKELVRLGQLNLGRHILFATEQRHPISHLFFLTVRLCVNLYIIYNLTDYDGLGGCSSLVIVKCAFDTLTLF